jgi:hypothetical protein
LGGRGVEEKLRWDSVRYIVEKNFDGHAMLCR